MADQTVAHRKILQEAKERFNRCVEWESTARARALDDEKFANGDSYNSFQWPSEIYNNRVHAQGRPALTINRTQVHNLQIINDARQNKASVRIRPVGDGATFEASQVFEGIIRHIEYQSNATVAYDKATNDQVNSGIGYWLVETDYQDNDTFDQEIYVRRVPNARNVYLDPDIQEYDGSDANFGFIFSSMPNDQFEAKYPGYKSVANIGTLNAADDWNTKDHTRVAKYYRRSMKPDTLFATPDGATIKASEVRGTEMLTQLREAVKRKEIRSRRIMSPKIDVYKIAADQIIDESEWAGIYIPIVRVVGIETVIDGTLDRRGHTRCMIDAQRMYNYWTSCAVEFGALQTKAPYLAPAEAIENREEEWATANTSNAAVLTYNHKDDANNPIPAPVRAQPPVASTAYTQGMATAANELMAVSGQFQAELGMPGNEKSGVAINARQRQGDTATAHFLDHLAIAIRYTGRIFVDLIPKIYDTERVVRILAADGTDAEVHINPDHPDAHEVQGEAPDTKNVFNVAQQAKLIFNPNVGRYDVQSDVGPNFGTQRQEAFNAFTEILTKSPDLVSMIGDIMFRNADFPGADEVSERFKEARAGTTVPAAQMQAAQAQLQQLQGLLQKMTETLADEKRRSGTSSDQKAIDEYRAETDRMGVVGKIDPAALLPLIRQMVSEVMGEPALPHIALHQAANGSMAPDDADPMAAQQAAHGMAMDRAQHGLAADQHRHQQMMDVAGHQLAVQQAMQPAAPAAGGA